MEDFKRILYPVALTEISPKVVPFVVTMARQLDAQVHLLHVLRRFDWFVDTYVSESPEPDFKRVVSDFESQVLAQAKQKLDAFQKIRWQDQEKKEIPTCGKHWISILEN
jgi:nucleotide-binding universal stress UspA family protein